MTDVTPIHASILNKHVSALERARPASQRDLDTKSYRATKASLRVVAEGIVAVGFRSEVARPPDPRPIVPNVLGVMSDLRRRP